MDKKSTYFKEVCREIIEEIKKSKKQDKHSLNQIKIRISRREKLSLVPTNIDLSEYATDKERNDLKEVLSIKPTRISSGVNVVALMTAPLGCPHGKCTFCPGGPGSVFGDTPQSYTGNEPSSMRGKRNNYDSYLITFNRLEQYICMNRIPDKVELIIMGGTFPSYPKKYQQEFIGYAFKAFNDFSDLFFEEGKLQYEKFLEFFELPDDIGSVERTKRIQEKCLELKNKSPLDIEAEFKKNEKAIIRNVGLTIETKPDWARTMHANLCLSLGCTRIEMGIQTLYDDVLKEVNRGHTVQETIDATRELKDLGFKINYHFMIGLPGVSKEQDLAAFKRLFEDSDFRPDMLKIYPCRVFPGTKLHDDWKAGKYVPLTDDEAQEIITECLQQVPEYCRVMRIQRDIPGFVSDAGPQKTNMRQEIEAAMNKKGLQSKDIRAREIGRTNKVAKSYEIKVIKYEASEGTDFFIEAHENNMLLGYCRLRFPAKSLREEITENSAIIRELHVYGNKETIGIKGVEGESTQHRGIGKKLMQSAELLMKENSKNKSVVISAVGTRKYYEKLGYHLEGPYMVKEI